MELSTVQVSIVSRKPTGVPSSAPHSRHAGLLMQRLAAQRRRGDRDGRFPQEGLHERLQGLACCRHRDPMAELGPTALFLGFFAAFQFALVPVLLHRSQRGPLRLLCAVLLALNGAVAARFAWISAVGQFADSDAAIAFFDEPTGVAILALGIVLLVVQEPASAGWGRGRSTLAAAALAAVGVGFVVALAAPTIAPTVHGTARTLYFDVYALLPVYFGYGLLAAVLAWKSTTATESRTWLLLTVAFAPRSAEFAWLYGVQYVVHPTPNTFDGSLDENLQWVARAWLVLGTVAAFAFAGRPLLRPRPESRFSPIVMSCLLAGLGIGLALSFGPSAGPGLNLGWYVLSVLTLFVVRPLFLGLALERERTLQTLGVLLAETVLFAGSKALLAAITGTRFSNVDYTDAVAASLALLCFPFLWNGVSRIWPSSRSVGPTPNPRVAAAPPGRAGPTRAVQLAFFLLQRYEIPGKAKSVTKTEVLSGTGITENNLAGEVARLDAKLRTLLEPPSASARLVEVSTVGVKGRKTYQLTDAGAACARRLREAQGPSLPP